MLRFDVPRMLKLRGEKRGKAYLLGLGLTRGQVRRLMSRKGLRSVPMRTMKRLCEALSCLPEDLFRWEGDEGHALARLNRHDPDVLRQRLNAMSAEELEALLQEKGARPLAEPDPKGVLYLNVKRLMTERGLSANMGVLRGRGLSERESYCLLRTTYFRVPVELLGRLCVALECGPNDLMAWTGRKDHVLGPLNRGLHKDRLELVRQVPLDRLMG